MVKQSEEKQGNKDRCPKFYNCLDMVLWWLNSIPFKLFVPCLFFAGGMYLQLVFEHYGTYVYIHRYAINDDQPAKEKHMTMYDGFQEKFFTYGPVDLKIIDTTVFVPAFAFLFLTIYLLRDAKLKFTRAPSQKDTSEQDRIDEKLETGKRRSREWSVIEVWTKVLASWALLATLKGIFDGVTTQPDSSNWEVCKERLHPWGVEWMRQEHSIWEMFILDFMFYFWTDHKYTPPMRLCCDMMYSGHTFTVTIFALGLYELILIFSSDVDKDDPKILYKKVIPILLLALGVLCHQGFEIYLVEKSHFHYTSDIFMAIVMSFLIWTNCAIPHFAKLWAWRGPIGLLPKFVNEDIEIMKASSSIAGKMQAWANQGIRETFISKELSQEKGLQVFDPSGNLLIPCCCIPFCHWHGREHLYTDDQINKMIEHIIKEEDQHKVKLWLEDEMNINEGVTVAKLMEDLQKCSKKPAQDQMSTPESDAEKGTCAAIKKTCAAIEKQWAQQMSSSSHEKRIIGSLQFWWQVGLNGIGGFFMWRLALLFWTVATYNYIQQYGESSYTLTDPIRESSLFNHTHSAVPQNQTPDDLKKLINEGNHIQESLLEILFCLLFIVLFLFETTRKGALQVWAKSCVCFYLLIPITSVLVVVTSVPDPAGYEVCKARVRHCQHHLLHDVTVCDEDQWNFMQKPNVTLFELYHHSGKRNDFHPGHYCGVSLADFLGFTVLLALGIFEWALLGLRKYGASLWFKAVCLIAYCGWMCWWIGRTIVKYEEYRLHYTMDWIMSISLSLLLFTNGPICMVAKWLSTFPGKETKKQCFIRYYNFRRLGCWKAPFWNSTFFTKKLGLESLPESWLQEAKDFVDKEHILTEMKDHAHFLVSSGDIFIPPCCVPFCCLWGRHHIYETHKVRELIQQEKKKHEIEQKPSFFSLVDSKSSIGPGEVKFELQDYSLNVIEDVLLDDGFRLACPKEYKKFKDVFNNWKEEVYKRAPCLRPTTVPSGSS